jgi:hypothetical protein
VITLTISIEFLLTPNTTINLKEHTPTQALSIRTTLRPLQGRMDLYLILHKPDRRLHLLHQINKNTTPGTPKPSPRMGMLMAVLGRALHGPKVATILLLDPTSMKSLTMRRQTLSRHKYHLCIIATAHLESGATKTRTKQTTNLVSKTITLSVKGAPRWIRSTVVVRCTACFSSGKRCDYRSVRFHPYEHWSCLSKVG